MLSREEEGGAVGRGHKGEERVTRMGSGEEGGAVGELGGGSAGEQRRGVGRRKGIGRGHGEERRSREGSN